MLKISQGRKRSRRDRRFPSDSSGGTCARIVSRFERLPPAYQLAPKIATSRFVFLVRIATVSPSLSLSPFHTHRHSLSFSLSLFFVEHDVHLPRIIFLERPCRGRLSQGEIKYTHFRSFLFLCGRDRARTQPVSRGYSEVPRTRSKEEKKE